MAVSLGLSPDAVCSEEVHVNDLEKSNLQEDIKYDAKEELSFCSFVASGVICPYASSCKYTHDLETYLASKGPDLGPLCVNIKATGTCPYGVRCRFYLSHPKVDNELEQSTLKNSVAVKGSLLDRLRKKEYSFSGYDNLARTESESKAFCRSLSAVASEETPVDIDVDPPTVLFSVNKRERRSINFKNKLYLAPLTTVGNLPFRRICKEFGADITCGEMALATNLLKGNLSEWALVKRHPSEDIFGVQICGGYPDAIGKCVELLNRETDVDFIDINMGCPINLIFDKGMGSALLDRPSRMSAIIKTSVELSNVPITAKFRTGIYNEKNVFHKHLPLISSLGISAITLHGRSRQQRYTKEADWDYIKYCKGMVDSTIPFIGNGDIISQQEYYSKIESSGVDSILLARGALIKPWLFTEIKERRDWDISASERLTFIKKFCDYGLEHFGSDTSGVEKTRRFLLEWLSFLHRYVPIGLVESLPQKLNDRAPKFVGRNDLETLMASDRASDWISLSSIYLGKPPTTFTFSPKHKSNCYEG